MHERKPHVLIVHNRYLQRGGEDAVVDSELALLRARGHRVSEYLRSNEELAGLSKAGAAAQAFWSARSAQAVKDLIERERIDIVHAHNTFPLVSPSIYWAARRAGVPVVQTLHNFRLICPQALMLREERPCEDCVGKALPWPAVRHACYRDSVAQSAVLCGMLSLHRAIGTWRSKVNRYIALNEFCRGRFIAGGLPADRIVVKPNFVESGPPPAEEAPREGLLFVGRLSQEKGIGVLAEAMRRLQGRVPLRVVGSGPLSPLLDGLPGVQALGALDGAAVLQQMQRARLLVLPSIWYENFPRTLVEAFASGLPVLASDIGALADLVQPERTGRHFETGNAAALAAAIDAMHADVAACRHMGAAARRLYEQHYSPDANYQQLMAIYQGAQDEMKAESA